MRAIKGWRIPPDLVPKLQFGNAHLVIGLAVALSTSALAAPAWQPEVYPISYWAGPPHDRLDDHQVAEIAELGFTVMGNVSTPSAERTREVLDLARKHGLKAIVCDARIRVTIPDSPGWEAAVDAVVKDYAEHPALYGYYLKDEPNRAQFPNLAALNAAFLARDPAHLPYVNLFPTYASFAQLGAPSYRDHVEDFVRMVKPRFLSYDHYCLLTDGKQRPGYFENLEIVRDAARHHRVPFWQIVQLAPFHRSWRDPSEAELRWQVNTSLAYGCKGIWYFTFWTYATWRLGEGRAAIYDVEGRKTHHFEEIKRVNRALKTLGQTFLRLDSVNVYHTPNVPPGARRLGGDAPIKVAAGGDLLIGWLQDEGRRDHVMVVNKDYAEGCATTLTVRGPLVDVHEVSAQTGEEARIETVEGKPSEFSITLEPGGGRLFRLSRAIEWAEPPAIVSALPIVFETRSDLRAWHMQHSITKPRIVGRALTFDVTGRDPYVGRNRLRLPASSCRTLVIRMKKTVGKLGQVFWATAAEPTLSDKCYLNYPTIAGGQYHDIRIPVGDHPGWKGTITAIRIDPDVEGLPGAVAIESVCGEVAE